jgi:carboxypeptidase family protein
MMDQQENPMAAVAVTLDGLGSTITNSNGEYSFMNLPAGGPYFVTPSKAGYNFIPNRATIDNLTVDLTNLNFVSSFATGRPPRPHPTPHGRPTPPPHQHLHRHLLLRVPHLRPGRKSFLPPRVTVLAR